LLILKFTKRGRYFRGIIRNGADYKKKVKKGKNWQVYIIQTETGKLYTGITTDIDRRLNEHKKNKGAKYFRLENPQEVVFIELCKDRAEATKRELQIKRFNRNEKLKLIRK